MIMEKNKFYTSEKKQKEQTGCSFCKLHLNCISPKQEVYGEGQQEILIVNDFPSKLADKSKNPYKGEIGVYLRKYFKEIDLKRDCWHVYAIRCRKDKKITVKDISTCRIYLHKTIKELKPKKIIVLGDTALQSLIGDKVSVTDFQRWTGWKIPDQDFKSWLYPTYSIKYVLENPKNVMLEKFVKKHIRNAIFHEEEFPLLNLKEEKIEIITEPYAAIILLEGLSSFGTIDTIAFDYETTGKKPYRKGHEILSVSFSFDNKAYAFPIFKDNPDFMKALRFVLANKNIKKVGANILFEEMWTRVILGYKIKNWIGDVLLQQHIIDNRSGITSLKFQIYVHYGIVGYDDTIKKYIKTKDKSSHSFNKMKECPLNELLYYNAIDSFFTLKLYKKHIKEIKEKELTEAFSFFHEGLLTLMDMSCLGSDASYDYYEQQNKLLKEKLLFLEQKIINSKEVSLWDGGKKGTDVFNFNSDLMLRRLLFDILKYKSSKTTPSGLASVDASSLQKLNEKEDIKLISWILKWKKINKLQNTYLLNYLNEIEKGKINAQYALHLVRTYRGSCSNPNKNNIPKRDVYANKVVRTGIVPSKGFQLMEVDYKSMEVSIAACNHKDPVMLKYLNDPNSDMHRDQACELFIKKPEDITKEERYLSKNKFVFPQFYGDFYKNNASSLWEFMPDYSKENLSKNNILTYKDYENYVKQVEFDFWNKKFKVYGQWKIDRWNLYQRQCYLKSYTGFIYSGIMKKNDTLNYDTQGMAFHCLLWSITQIHKHLKKEKMRTKITDQTHDSALFDLCPEELEYLKPFIRKIMCESIKEVFKWIIVPLNISAEISDVNGNLAKLSPIII